MHLSKSQYLSTPVVKDFGEYLSDVIEGKVLVNHFAVVADKKVPSGYDRNLKMRTLEDAFNGYFWDGQLYAENACKLNEIKQKFHATCSNNSSVNEAYYSAINDCLFWGLGKGKAYSDNLKWAEMNISQLANLINLGVEIIDSDTPNIEPFKSQLRMNAGYTKVYALLCQNSIIYDGRVGAALGFLVRNFMNSRSCVFDEVPKELAFPWARSKSVERIRNPSKGKFIFPNLSNNSMLHVQWNIQANWILKQSLDQSASAPWLVGGDVMRKIEAALFMLGYDLAQVAR